MIDIDIDVEDILSNDEERWEELLDQIMAGNVIPVIGPDLQIEDEKNFHTQLIDLFATKFGITSKPQTFSQLIYDKDKKFLTELKKPEAIYKLINQYNYQGASALAVVLLTIAIVMFAIGEKEEKQ